MSDWTDEAHDLVRRLWTQGRSASQIALALRQRLGLRKSRNAVIGKVMRLGLPPRHAARNGSRPPATHRAIAARIEAEKQKRAPKPTQPPMEPATRGKQRPPSPEQGLMTFIEHRDYVHCAMFCEGEDGVHGRVCGRPCAEGATFCASCMRLAYTPAPPSRKQGRAA